MDINRRSSYGLNGTLIELWTSATPGGRSNQNHMP